MRKGVFHLNIKTHRNHLMNLNPANWDYELNKAKMKSIIKIEYQLLLQLLIHEFDWYF